MSKHQAILDLFGETTNWQTCQCEKYLELFAGE